MSIQTDDLRLCLMFMLALEAFLLSSFVALRAFLQRSRPTTLPPTSMSYVYVGP